MYAKSTNLPRVLGGLGVAIISTSSGLLTDRQAGKKGVGGEVLAYVWYGGREEQTCRESDDCPIPVPSGVDVTIDGRPVTVKGPKGDAQPHRRRADRGRARRGRHAAGHPAERRAPEPRPARPVPHAGRQHGHRRDRGLHQDARDRRCRLPRPGQGLDLEFALGFSHPVLVKAPRASPSRSRRPTRFSVSGIDKQQVGEVAANIRKLRKPDPYKGKGVRYQGEVIRRKVGKAGK